MNNSNTKVIISWILLSIVFFVHSSSLETEDHLDVINQYPDCQGRKCQIVEVKYLKRQKRSAGDFDLNFEFIINGERKILHLKASNGILVNPKTPVYYVTSNRNGHTIERKDNIFNPGLLGMHFIDEEKKAVASVIIDPITKEVAIKRVFIGTENVVVDQTNYNDKTYYIARTIPNSNTDILGIGLNLRYVPKLSSRIPETIYPEVLICVDYHFNNVLQDKLITYILEFWNAVDLYYRPLQNPRYKLSIAGVVVAMDENVFPFASPSAWGTNDLIPYTSSLDYMSKWLRNVQEVIPFNSYDTHIFMTPTFVAEGQPIGIAYTSSACLGVTASIPLGGIVHDPFNLEGILTAVHELGHVFGAGHDQNGPCSTHSIMAPSDAAGQELWSQCSKESFRSTLRNRDFSCMYNRPIVVENPSITVQIPINFDPNDNQPSTLFHKEISDDRYQLSVSFSQFAPNREIKVYYTNNKLVTTQLHDKVTASPSDPNASKEDLQGRFTDDQIIIFSPSIINPSKLVNIYHEDGYIYIYQGTKPTGDTNGSQQSDNNNQGAVLYSVDDQHRLCLQRSHFNLNKVVQLYYRNNLLYVSQRNVPDNPYLYNSPPFPSGVQAIPDTQVIIMIPTQISPGKKICVEHTANMIYINNLNQ
ncbi:zinc metalloproteinase/disintegrin isoform X2 [Microplitis demolitor]|uniref:zinc metalloproteinase/disintegrin isoform X2 n=1 Tax=Microplitis demolitor TaxID=69319 RepID=UPI00235B5F51|nr:zinc metalloproteinase/disintegrin isoform X2 [Microplitis demolitor]